MAYIQRNVINGIYTSSGQFRRSMMAAMKEAAETEGWTTIENEYNDGTYTRWVFEQPDGDFYVTFFCNTSTINSYSASEVAHLRSIISEGYNTSTRNFIRPAVTRITNFACSSSDDSLGTTEYTIGDVYATLGYQLTSSNYTLTTPSSFIVNAYNDGLSLAYNGSYGCLYAGSFDSLVVNSSTNDAYRYCVIGAGAGWAGALSSFTSKCSVTRSAMNSGKATHNWSMSTSTTLSIGINNENKTEVVNSLYHDLYQGNTGPTLTPIFFYRQQTTDINTHGSLRGVINHVLTGPRDGSIFDTVTVDGTTYINTVQSAIPWIERG